jgi:hypothetical protein
MVKNADAIRLSQNLSPVIDILVSSDDSDSDEDAAIKANARLRRHETLLKNCALPVLKIEEGAETYTHD